MGSGNRLADHQHPGITAKAAELTSGRRLPLDVLESIFRFVRDGIRFGFPPKWDEVTASEVLGYGVGYCTTKATLFVALCRAAGLSARVHFGLIDIGIMRGILPAFAFPFMPRAGGHAWVEVLVDGAWRPVDSYIDDARFYAAARERLRASGRRFGFSVAYLDGRSSCELNFGEQGFVHMGAVVEDHGAWDDPADYFASERYVRMNALQRMSYPLLARLANRKVAAIRAGAA
jgi:hypothetical protein